jgi:hypothetical protein
MTAKRVNRLLLIVLILAVVLAGGILFVSNYLMRSSANQLVQAKLDNVGFDNAERSYLQARQYLEEYSELNDVMQKVLPKSKDQAQAVSELYKIGDETGIKIASIQFPSSSLGQKNTSSSAVTQAKTVDGMPGVLGIDVSVELEPASGASISYANMISFLQKVELNRRNMQIKQITVNADVINGGVTFNAIITTFVKP